MFWFIYIVALVFLSHISTRNIKNNSLLLTLVVLVFLTPAQIEASNSEIAPSLFIFIFNILFQQDFSIRPLRPLLISIPSFLIFLILFSYFKRKFF